MTGYITVKELNNTGTFVSDLDYDKHFSEKENPKGYFKTVIQPIENAKGQNEIKYEKCKEGFTVYGEAYIITGRGAWAIDKKIENWYANDVFPNLVFTEQVGLKWVATLL